MRPVPPTCSADGAAACCAWRIADPLAPGWIRLATILVAIGLAGCVVTTHEGPGDPPRVATPPRPRVSSVPLDERPTAEPAVAAGLASPRDAAPRSVAASHLLIMHRGSMRAPAGITRTREQASERAQQALARARSGEDFKTLVAEYSDEPGAALREGRLGNFTRDDMVKPFADAAFRLAPGEVSDVVETPFGFHVILRTQ